MKYTKQMCIDCSKALGFKLNDSKPKRCRSCRTSLLGKDPTQNSMYGKQHKNRDRFRSKNFDNVNYDDRIEEFSSSGNSRKKYRMSCDQCGCDRGYQRNVDAKRLCKKCRDLNTTSTSKVHRHVRNCMRANLNARLKQRLLSKNKKSSFAVLPYTIDELIKHLESKFEPGMTWDNHGQGPGTWQIDHITPDSWFVYNSMEDQEFKNCWSLNNLQPLWWHDNCSKGNRYQG